MAYWSKGNTGIAAINRVSWLFRRPAHANIAGLDTRTDNRQSQEVIKINTKILEYSQKKGAPFLMNFVIINVWQLPKPPDLTKKTKKGCF